MGGEQREKALTAPQAPSQSAGRSRSAVLSSGLEDPRQSPSSGTCSLHRQAGPHPLRMAQGRRSPET